MNDTTDLINISTKLKNSADKLIQESDIENIVSSLGKIHFVGGYRLDVLCRPDLDIIIKSEDEPSREKAIAVTQDLLNKRYIQTVGFADTYNFEVENKPKGYYWELIAKVDDVQWKIDMWYMKIQSNYPVIDVTSEFVKLLKENPEKREIILKLKMENTEDGKYKHGLNGFKIYDAVLKNNIYTSEDLKNFYKIL